jgi:hypothetical protein
MEFDYNFKPGSTVPLGHGHALRLSAKNLKQTLMKTNKNYIAAKIVYD